MDSVVTSNYLSLHAKLLRYVGVSLNKEETAWNKFYSLALISFIWSYPLVAFHAVFVNHYPLDLLLENLAYAIATANCCSRVFALFRIRKRVGKTLCFLQSTAFAPKVERGGLQEKILADECTFYVNAQTMVLYVMVTANVSISVAAALIPRLSYSDPQKWVLPYGGFAVFNANHSPKFEIAFVYQAVAVAIIGSAAVTVTTFIAGVMAYISYQFKVLQNFVRNSVEYTKKKIEQSDGEREEILMWKHFRQTVKEIVEYHTDIINLREQFKELMGFTI